MNNNYITQLNKKKVFNKKGGYNPRFNNKKNQYYRKTPGWLLCKQRLINVRGLYLKHMYVNLHKVIIYKYMHVILLWWYILFQRYIYVLQQAHYIRVWCEYYIPTGNFKEYSVHTSSHHITSGMVNAYHWTIGSFKRKKRGLYMRKRTRRGGFFRIRKNPVSYGRYLPPKQYALLKAFSLPSNRAGWEEKFILPLNIVKMRRIITLPRKGFERKRYVFINFTSFTVRQRSNTYLYYTNLK